MMNLDDEDMNSREGIVSSAKRKRTSQIFTSDDETSCDDNLMTMLRCTNKSEDTIIDKSEVHSANTRSAKTRRVLKFIETDDGRQHNTRLSTGYEDEVKDDASKQCPTTLTKSESENKQEDKVKDVYSQDGDEANDADDFKANLKQNGRQNVSNVKWDNQRDMLADFGKNTELCMRAVCALYRKQTADEKASKETRYLNGRGFDKEDAFRGCELAEFLTEGSLDYDLNKTVEELEQHNFKWIKVCRELATYYSGQLFKIYRNKEDPYFLPE